MQIFAITGETCRYHVASERNPRHHYLVDLLDNECSCTDWTCRQKAHKEATGQAYRCKHIRAARHEFLEDILERLREDQLSR